MHGFDSLTLKTWCTEYGAFFEGATLQKIQQPSKRELVLTFRNIGETRKFYVNVQPDFAHICFKEGGWGEIPKQAPMFCMLLRKYLAGARVVEFKNVEYERILEIYFNAYDEIGSTYQLCLCIELMGKHSNVILYNAKTRIIIGCVHNISSEKSSVRELYGGISYIYPPAQHKTNILKTSYGSFCAAIEGKTDIVDAISRHYYYLSKPLVEEVLYACEGKGTAFFEGLQNLATGDVKVLIEHFGGGASLNEAVEKYFSKYMNVTATKKIRSELEKIVQKELKKAQKALAPDKKENKAEEYKKKGENYLTSGKIGEAQKYFKLYKKEKNAQKYRENFAQESSENQKYWQEILFQVQNAMTTEELDEIKDIIAPNSQNAPKKTQKITLESFERGAFTIYLGKNSRQNDYLISKIASSEDYWFHALDYPSAHVVLKNRGGGTPKTRPPKEILEFCAKLVKENSPLKDSAKASIIYTKKKYLKKPPGTKPGYVTYEGEKEIII